MATSIELTLLQALSTFKDFKFEEFKVGSEDWVDYLDRFYRTVKLRGLDETSTHADVVKMDLSFVSKEASFVTEIEDVMKIDARVTSEDPTQKRCPAEIAKKFFTVDEPVISPP
ncbi:hypothetical protein RF11_00240 [Thelohanellus kitauei]|uniref:Uncharacterized protein n=1 Tax=Thelohanellus kitauei TaxID=669202 RepID=A0A0C2NEH5_THEKT|nr:hypothetical protein RF11_00240 [Thelohanellus kitauei]